MMKVGEVKMKRKVNVIEDLDGKKTVFIHDILFKGKRAVKWDEVEKYLRQYVGDIQNKKRRGQKVLKDIKKNMEA